MGSLKASRSSRRASPPKSSNIKREKRNPWLSEKPARSDGAPADATKLSDLPPEATEKLRSLQSVAGKLQLKLAAMQEGDTQGRLKITRQLLDQTEKQIANLQRQYED